MVPPSPVSWGPSPTDNTPATTATPATPAITREESSLFELVQHDFNQADIHNLLRLGPTVVDKLFGLLEKKGQAGTKRLLESLEGVPERDIDVYVRAYIVSNIRRCSNRPPSDSIAPAPALVRNSPAPARHNLLKRPASPSPSISIETKRTAATRADRPCPYCGDITNKYEKTSVKHFCTHIPQVIFPHLQVNLKDPEFQELLIACGFCPSVSPAIISNNYNPTLEVKKAFLGIEKLNKHTFESHTKFALGHGPEWSLDTCLMNQLSGEPNMQAMFHALLVAKHPHNLPVLHWAQTVETRSLLHELQIIGGKVYSKSYADADDNKVMQNLVQKAYSLALKSVPTSIPSKLPDQTMRNERSLESPITFQPTHGSIYRSSHNTSNLNVSTIVPQSNQFGRGTWIGQDCYASNLYMSPAPQSGDWTMSDQSNDALQQFYGSQAQTRWHHDQSTMALNNMTLNNMAPNSMASNNMAPNTMAPNNIVPNNIALNNIAPTNITANNMVQNNKYSHTDHANLSTYTNHKYNPTL
ncbi:hypothetical protein K504DRAFT_489961 [Pleomassaria siparia CBS 279.74]|uniref:Uncharacterized protein n=1 Tax=Pleomassaria siparia CBS 279.74 TaxID=1314801 RepID=A0A6G1KEZ8_9PLEO|nr:hypothetical protein K504DRAFT_489961 [Pleomassaria siparia CBS 279.74]